MTVSQYCKIVHEIVCVAIFASLSQREIELEKSAQHIAYKKYSPFIFFYLFLISWFIYFCFFYYKKILVCVEVKTILYNVMQIN